MVDAYNTVLKDIIQISKRDYADNVSLLVKLVHIFINVQLVNLELTKQQEYACHKISVHLEGVNSVRNNVSTVTKVSVLNVMTIFIYWKVHA